MAESAVPVENIEQQTKMAVSVVPVENIKQQTKMAASVVPVENIEQQTKMAASTVPVENIKQHFLQCGICQKEFDEKERVPKMLPCIHSFCCPCLEEIWKEQTTSINCPKCGKVWPVNQTISNTYPTDFISMKLANFIHLQKTAASVACTNCPDEKTASHYCLYCQHYICENCLRAHTKFFVQRGHKVLPIDKLIESPVDFFKQRETCKKHEDQKLDLFCHAETCKKAVCPSCAIVDHFGHTICHLENVYEEEKGKINELAENLKIKQNEVMDHAAFLQSLMDDLKATELALSEDIESQIDDVILALKARKEELKKSLKSMVDEQHEKLKVELASTLASKESITEGLDYCHQAVSIARPAEFLSLKKRLQDQLESLSAFSVAFDENSIGVGFATRVIEEFKESVQMFGQIFDKTTVHVDRPGEIESIQELKPVIAVRGDATIDIHLQGPEWPQSKEEHQTKVVLENVNCQIKTSSQIERKEIQISCSLSPVRADTLEWKESSSRDMTVYFCTEVNGQKTLKTVQCSDLTFSSSHTGPEYTISHEGRVLNRKKSPLRPMTNIQKPSPAVAVPNFNGCGCHYWQINVQINVLYVGEVDNAPVFQAYIVNSENADPQVCIVYSVTTCKSHRQLCLKVSSGSQVLLHFPMGLGNVTSSFSLDTGFLLDLDECKLHLFDINKNVRMCSTDSADVREPLWLVCDITKHKSCDTAVKLLSGMDLCIDSKLLMLLGSI